ncbi:MAG: hypothetical protein JRN52_09485 [Nitrososphaerota archaeon]|nr:hypothetical protein [Nitrososphaerota archaeon]
MIEAGTQRGSQFITAWATKDFLKDATKEFSGGKYSKATKQSQVVAGESLQHDILKCVDNGLSKFGASIKQSVYWQLQNKHKIEAKDIPLSPQQFSEALEKILGYGGAIMVERAIADELVSKFGIEFLPKKRFTIALDKILNK